MHRAQSFLGQGIALGHQPRDAEVCNLHGAVFQHHNIVGLDIPVNNAPAVGVLQRLGDLDAEMEGLLPVQHAFFLHILLQRDSVDQFHHNIVRRLRGGNIVDGDDIRVAQHSNRLALRVKAAAEFLVRRIIVFQNLDRYQAV